MVQMSTQNVIMYIELFAEAINRCIIIIILWHSLTYFNTFHFKQRIVEFHSVGSLHKQSKVK